MKSSRLALLSALVFCSSAMATGTYTPPPPPPAPAPSQPSTSTSSATSGSESSATSTATSAATGGSVGDTTATASGGVGNGGIGQGGVGVGGSARSGDSYSASQSGDVTNRVTSQYVNFPQPVWTTVPTPYGCIVSKSRAGSFGWNFVSGSGSEQFSDAVCTTVRMAEAAALHCHFATAAMLNKAAFELMYPGQKGDFFLADNPKNLDPVACDELRRPVLRMVPAIQNPPPVVHGGVAAPSVNVVCTGPVTPPTRYLRAQKARPATKAQACK